MVSPRDMIAFWIFGLTNNFAYVIMLSAAGDIIFEDENTQLHVSKNRSATLLEDSCKEEITMRHCNEMSAGTILLADIIPTLMVKFTFPFFMHRIPFGFRHFVICSCQAISFVTVALASNIYISLIGVVFASIGSGLGEICYLALTAHYSKNAISMWSSGTGGAGIAGAVIYAAMTEPHFAGLSVRTTLLSMLIVPVIFALTYWIMLTPSPSIHRMQITDHKTWVVPKNFSAVKAPAQNDIDIKKLNSSDKFANEDGVKEVAHRSFIEKLTLILPLLRYMIPLCIVYIAQYLINQGIVELIDFDCQHSFWLSKSSQYRWYQVLYQIGVFISRSSVNFVELSAVGLFILPILQLSNMTTLIFDSIYMFVSHVWIIFAIILFEGLIGGASYVNTFNRIHKEAPREVREFSLSVASCGSSSGILLAGLAAIPTHNIICRRSI